VFSAVRNSLTLKLHGVIFNFILIERKLMIPQIRGIKGEAVDRLLRALDNEGDGVSSAFPKGKQNGILFKMYISLIDEL